MVKTIDVNVHSLVAKDIGSVKLVTSAFTISKESFAGNANSEKFINNNHNRLSNNKDSEQDEDPNQWAETHSPTPLPLLADSLPLLSPTYKTTAPHVPPIISSTITPTCVKSPTTPTYTKSYKKSYKPSPALDSDDDDDVPLVYLQSSASKPSSLLSDQEEDNDKYLVLIAVLDIKPTEEFQTAADKYKKPRKDYNLMIN
ncbi:hypothetical protein MAM1_0050d03318 [Mucor ambiguus]|uniref:Uncharacterized protein n=1 Tax=Mucor ambiguus TaxID=91626 RepID=A0A0C9MPB7_9FUNG|nr:hypothetical protein MAM1_0050d03318 [Mucor ambiguus]